MNPRHRVLSTILHLVFTNRFSKPINAPIAVASIAVVVFGLGLLVGCDGKPVDFPPNQVHAMTLERSRDLPVDAASSDVAVVIESWFGSPDEPRWPADILGQTPAATLVSVDNLRRAAGPVYSDQDNVHFGLYREHCVICHGISGSGAGPASLHQYPYPRDLRAGVFKWKSTSRTDKPTREDWSRLLVEGVRGSAMPSFSTVPPDDREALIDYAIYLSVRGQTERELLAAALDELDYQDSPPADDLRLVSAVGASGSQGGQVARDILVDVVSQWASAAASPVPAETVADADSLLRGQELFHGQIANCAACHGPDGRGGVPTLDHDDWTKEFTTRIGITPTDRDATKPFRRAGALPPRPIDPRIVHGGVIRGGDDPETLFRRIQHGIAGTPMPGVGLKADGDDDSAAATTGLTATQIWDIVHYLQSIQLPGGET